MLFLQLTAVATLAALSAAAPTTATKHVLHEERVNPHRDWIKSSRIEGSAIIPMRIGLTQNNLEKGYDYLMEVSHPESSKYGSHWTAEEVHSMFAPSEESVAAVREWLLSSGIDEDRVVHTENKGWLAFDATVEEAERLLLAEFYEHEHKHSDKVRVGCDRYHVPEHLQPHIDYITPGIKLTPVVKRSVKTKRSNPLHHKVTHSWPIHLPPFDGIPWWWKPPGAHKLPTELQGCGRNITPACIQALYSLPKEHKAVPGHSLGLYEQGDYFIESDLSLYYEHFAPYVPNNTLPVPALIDGAAYSVPVGDPNAQGEAIIDIELATSLVYPQTVTLYQDDDQIYGPAEVALVNTFNTFLDALDGSYCSYSAYGETGNDPDIDPVYPDPAAGGYKGKLQCGIYKPTNVISASYGEAEADLPANYAKRQCNEFMKLGLQGHSIMVSSGDYGVASIPGDVSPNGCLGPEGKIFNPTYPSNCPYVTSVGATMLYADQTVRDPESAMAVDLGGSAANFSSAGGFSNYYSQPSYQKTAVEHYFKTANLKYPSYSELNVNLNTTKGLFNRIGRAYPDVSANGAFLITYVDNVQNHFFGTSLASPIMASVITLLNEDRHAIGKKPIGFLNAIFYAHPEVFNDIKNGTNLGCNTEGFAAIPGWDPVTGLGTPNYPAMKKLFLELP
ncbi:Pro-kumamolisin, activation domain-containing protein [Xylogone sp. PMI_703]|nr:Pro-kumamolisin, activation domain-containing protein [Xylogone sp. PMI_703]